MLSNDFWHGFFIGDMFILLLAFLKQRLFVSRTPANSGVTKGQQ